MKKIIILMIAICATGLSYAQQNKRPIVVKDNHSTVKNITYKSKNYAQQGNQSFINNSMFYNSNANPTNTLPQGNGNYVKPGNSNPINHQLNSNPEPGRVILVRPGAPVLKYNVNDNGNKR